MRTILAHVLRRLTVIAKWVVEPDRLPTPAPDRPHEPLDFPQWLAGRESLPSFSDSLKGRRRFFSWLSSSESLADGNLAQDPSYDSFFRWLCTGEQLTTPHRSEPTKEASNHES